MIWLSFKYSLVSLFVFNFWYRVKLSPLVLRPLNLILIDRWVLLVCGMHITMEIIRKEKNCCSAALSTTNPMQISAKMNLGLCRQQLVINHQSYRMTQYKISLPFPYNKYCGLYCIVKFVRTKYSPRLSALYGVHPSNEVGGTSCQLHHTCVTRCSNRCFDGLTSFSLYSTFPTCGSGGSWSVKSTCTSQDSSAVEGSKSPRKSIWTCKTCVSYN